MSERAWDAIVIGAGSVGTPAALALAEAGARVLVLDGKQGPGQGANKAAIGGVRATFSDPAKVAVCRRTIEIFAGWRERRGEDLEWRRGGYVFPAWRDEEEHTLRDLVVAQRKLGLDIRWLDAAALREVVPDLETRDLRGGTFSPGDGHLSPLLALHAMYVHARRAGAEFRFHEPVRKFHIESGAIRAVETNHGLYNSPRVIVAAGSDARAVAALAGVDVPVRPDEHEAGVSEPVAHFLNPMVVDLRPGPGSANCYFYQHATGQVIFCLTPSPPQWGDDTRETSAFLPMIAARLVAVMPRLAGLRVRRTWRGLYPMTPDGSPIVGPAPGVDGLLLAVGMCGQGFMIGPGLGELLARLVMVMGERGAGLSSDDRMVLERWSPTRPLAGMEKLG